jgi:uncharacterized protein (TIGR02996 family)
MTPANAYQGLLRAIVENPLDETTHLGLADWLEEYGDPRRAELLRLHRRLLATCCEPYQHPQRAGWQARVVELLSQVRPCLPQRSSVLGKGVEMAFNFIPPGTFLMGRPEGEDGRGDEVPQHLVTLSKGFFLGVYQVTQAQWQAVMGNKPSNFRGDNRPVEQVSWEDCQKFCRKLAERDGKRYRLPTEAQWEYACRAGTTTDYCSGNGLDALRQVGWCSFDGDFRSAKETKPVGQFQPNAWGLYDMHGNGWEWCQDGRRTYSSGAIEDPVGPQNKEEVRVLRGGPWLDFPIRCRSATRYRPAASNRNGSYGCRLVLCLD